MVLEKYSLTGLVIVYFTGSEGKSPFAAGTHSPKVLKHSSFVTGAQCASPNPSLVSYRRLTEYFSTA